MENELYQLLLTGGAMGLFYILYLIVKIVFSKKKDNGSTEILQKIQANDMQHIGAGIVEQNVILRHHTELLVRIVTLLELQSKK